MNPLEKNKYKLELIQLQSEFIKIGVTKCPTTTVRDLMPEGLTNDEAIRWDRRASDFWNGRSMDFETYLPVFKKAYEILKDETKVA